ncbi:MAG: helix-turn-helix transcriptional regulator [Tepidiformaceae bacterium]
MAQRDGRHQVAEWPTLSQRQREVLAMIAKGHTNFEIAQALGISLEGAKYHVREVMAKLGAESREDAVERWAAARSSSSWTRRLPAVLAGGLFRWVAVASVSAVVAGGGFVAWRHYAGADGPTAGQATLIQTLSHFGRLRPDGTPYVDPAIVLKNGQPIVFTLCAEQSDWQRATLAQFAARSSASGDAEPSHEILAAFLMPFHYLPAAGSPAGAPTAIPRPEQPVSADSACSAPGTDREDEIALSGYRIVELRQDGEFQMVALVEASPGSFHSVRFVSQAKGGLGAAPGNDYPIAFALVQYVDRRGALLSEQGSDFSDWSAGTDRELAVARLRTRTQAMPLRVEKATSFTVYRQNRGVESTLIVLDGAGQVLRRYQLDAQKGPWEPVETLSLDAGNYGLAVAGGSDVLIIPAGTPILAGSQP